jgi:hypothetical protein
MRPARFLAVIAISLIAASCSEGQPASGGLVSLALLDGTVAAFDDTTLEEIWKINVGSRFSAPPMAFDFNGKQYVAMPLSKRSLITAPRAGRLTQKKSSAKSPPNPKTKISKPGGGSEPELVGRAQ